ncbi:PP2C family serine/threonine-protein phosphatase [Helicobacter cetorum]|uniref:PP2C family serine/threonine-protein phosphatase n=1 Tax=Helicobacter cetorum TaxID=138563 RepID=UPI000CF095DF|nr:PP2C family serine/threonine-protein phosphatase [Helicobacter cetorum]
MMSGKKSLFSFLKKFFKKIRSFFVKRENWIDFSGSCIGGYHVQKNMPNQDSFLTEHHSGISLAVVCDGLGSKKFSHIGSSALTKAVKKAVIEKIESVDFDDLALLEKQILKFYLEGIKPYEFEDCLSTLLIAIVLKNQIIIGRVGDGMIMLLGKQNQILEESKIGEKNKTIPFGYGSITWSIYKTQDVESIFLCSDGISEELENNQKIGFVQALMQEYQDKSKQEAEQDINQWLKDYPPPTPNNKYGNKYSDDKTFVLLLKRGHHG